MKAVLLVLLLAGCAQYDATKSAVIDTAAHVSDIALSDAELLLCRGISVGAWRRAYGQKPEKAAAWKILCADNLEVTP